MNARSPLIDEQIKGLHRHWPQAAYDTSSYGSHLIIVPSVLLHGYNKTICTVLFVAPPGYPSACPENFWTDVQGLELLEPIEREVELHDGLETYVIDRPENTNEVNPIPGFDHWKDLTWWSWHLQDWHPSKCSLVTYMRVIQNRLERKP